MQVIDVDISTIKPYQWNSKSHSQEQIKRIAESITRYGWVQPIVVDADNVIVVGHGRYQAAQLLKITKVPAVRVTTLTESEIRSLRIVDNKVAADTSWDLGNLELEVRALADAGYDVEPFHFEEFKFQEPPEEVESKQEPKTEWIGQIKLKVSADQIDSFEARLDELCREFEGIVKETKRAK